MQLQLILDDDVPKERSAAQCSASEERLMGGGLCYPEIYAPQRRRDRTLLWHVSGELDLLWEETR